MANETKVIRRGCIVPMTVDTEITEDGEYPVQGKAIYQALGGGTARVCENVPKAASAPTKAEFNALIDALISCGLMKAAANKK